MFLASQMCYVEQLVLVRGNLSFDETKPVDGENPGEIKPVATRVLDFELLAPLLG